MATELERFKNIFSKNIYETGRTAYSLCGNFCVRNYEFHYPDISCEFGSDWFEEVDLETLAKTFFKKYPYVETKIYRTLYGKKDN